MIKQTVVIEHASAQDIYDVLLSADKHSDLIGDSAEIEDREAAEFSTFGGYATGTNLELLPGKLIKQTWRASDWPEDHFSIITFVLSDSEQGAVIEFTQENEPDGTQEEFESGWEDFYWKPLREYFS